MLNVDYSYILQMIPRIAFDFILLTLANRHATKYVGTSPFGDVRSHRALDNIKDDRMTIWYWGQVHIRFYSKQRRIALSPAKFDTQ